MKGGGGSPIEDLFMPPLLPRSKSFPIEYNVKTTNASNRKKTIQQVLSASSTNHPKLYTLQNIQIAVARHGVSVSLADQIVSIFIINTTGALAVITVFGV